MLPLVDHLTTQVGDAEGGVESSAAAEADPSVDDIVSLELDSRDGEGTHVNPVIIQTKMRAGYEYSVDVTEMADEDRTNGLGLLYGHRGAARGEGGDDYPLEGIANEVSIESLIAVTLSNTNTQQFFSGPEEVGEAFEADGKHFGQFAGDPQVQ